MFFIEFDIIDNINFKGWVFLIILLNVLIYVFSLVVFFAVLFLSDLSILKITSNFRNLTYTSFSMNLLVFLFLSLAGLPPFISFAGKFFLFTFLFYNTNWILIILFFLFGSFTIYFYIQHLRLLFSKTKSFHILFKNKIFFLNFHLLYIIIFILFFLIFGIFFISDFFIYLSPFLFF